MNLYLRILSYVKPYWYFMAGAMVCMACFALTSSATVWVALPFLQTLFGQDSVQTDQPGQPGQTGQTVQTDQTGQPGQTGQFDIARDSANRLEQRTGMAGLRESLKDRTNALITRPTRQATLERLCLIILFILLIKNISSYLQAYLMAYAENGVIKDLRNHLYIHLHRLSLSYFHRERTGELISRVSYDVMKINGTVSAAFGTLIKEPMLVVVYLAILLI
ncbi:MAG: ABC transporter transmembrane domain-containing protein, partial [Gemmatimonadetes bacterium]|nr:ABC transporter transmembrane domain-containing protein [Gemmatimonadota bacterium]